MLTPLFGEALALRVREPRSRVAATAESAASDVGVAVASEFRPSTGTTASATEEATLPTRFPRPARRALSCCTALPSIGRPNPGIVPGSA